MNQQLNFGAAVDALKTGKMIARTGWNGKGMYVFMQIGNTVSKDFIPNFKSLPDSVKTKLAERGTDIVFNSSMTIMTATGELQPGWHPSQLDTLSEDWIIVE